MEPSAVEVREFVFEVSLVTGCGAVGIAYLGKVMEVMTIWVIQSAGHCAAWFYLVGA